MAKSLEFEERLMLEEDSYHLLMGHYSSLENKKKHLNITNIYFDTPNYDILSSHSVLRIRYFDNEENIELTYKIGGKDGDVEITDFLNKEDYKNLIDNSIFPNKEVSKYLAKNHIEIQNVKKITSLRCERLEISFPSCLVVIDKNYYNDIIDYDLEIEAETKLKAKEEILKIANNFSLEYKNVYLSKSRRSFLTIKK